jgi:hypothetical protein
MDNIVRKMTVAALIMVGLTGNALAYAGTTSDFCHSKTFSTLPESAVSSLFNLNKAGLANQLGAVKMLFTTAGYKGYLMALRQSGTLANVHDGVKITAKADGPRQMTGPCNAPVVRVPSRFIFVDGKKAYHLQYTVVLKYVADAAFPMVKIAQMVVIPPLKVRDE